MNVSVVVPVYNSQNSLRLLIDRLLPVLAQVAEQYEVVFVEDGSRDQSWSIVQELAAKQDFVRGIRQMRNFGQHNALLCGIRHARHEVVVTIDDDLQNPPEEIPKLLEKLGAGFDVVYGVPNVGQHGLLRNAASTITKLALKGAMGVEVARDVSAFRAFRTHLRSAFAEYRGSFVAIDVLLTWGTSNFASVVVRHDARPFDSSNYTLKKLITHAANMVTGFSVWPLQLASVIGFFFTLFGIAIFVYVVGRFLVSGTTVPGFSFLASMIAIFSGAQLFALGIMGEYLARMHFRAIEKPSYVVMETCERTREDSAESR